LDGPPSSGLLYETAKNLALSGVRCIVIVQSDDEMDALYHNEQLDDLGKAYQRSIRAELEELGHSTEDITYGAELLMHYIRRLNPGVEVSLAHRTQLQQQQQQPIHDGEINRRVLVSVDRPPPSNLQLNQMARENDWAFVAVETAGVFGRVFCDFGSSFQVEDADGESPLVTPLDRIEEDGNTLVVNCILGEKHDVSKGDQIEFQLRNGSAIAQRCVVTNVQNPFRFSIQLLEGSSPTEQPSSSEFVAFVNRQAASFRRVKVPQTIEFLSLDEALRSASSDPSLFAACDLEKSFDEIRKIASMACFQALYDFMKEKNRHPQFADMTEFWYMSIAAYPSMATVDPEEAKSHLKSFLRGCGAKLTPFLAVFGAIAAQEALKASTSLYFPIKQLLLYDCDEVLPKLDQDEARKRTSCLVPGLRYILGDDSVDTLQSKQLFIVGAGAIGCELLKNLASMGVGTKGDGNVCLTDMDTIEKSNLSRQLLFRDNDIGDFKSAAAQKAARRFLPDIKIESHTSRVGAGESTPFDDAFWSNRVDVVLNALDNVEARLFMDEQCVRYSKALVDAGTMGSKGNVQVVVPNQSESYASSVDPPEPSIAVCTLKNFPYAIAHTIQWARDLFDGLFQRRCDRSNQIIEKTKATTIDDIIVKLVSDSSEEAVQEIAVEVNEDLLALSIGEDKDLKSLAFSWAATMAVQFFLVAPRNLIKEHPLESRDEDGEAFWSGTRRPPRELSFCPEDNGADQNVINSNLVDFVREAARLRFETITGKASTGTDSMFTSEDAASILSVAYEQYRNEADNTVKSETSAEESLRTALDHASSLLSDKKMSTINFEKDDEANGHVAFVNAASNLRAICYGISPVDQTETRRVAGNIVPAMITTTALVSGLSCIELLKLAQNLPLRSYRNAFINLALSFFAFTVPLPAEPVSIYNGRSYTIWDRLTIKESKMAAAKGGITMRSMMRRLNEMISDDSEKIDISSISLGPYLLYASFLHEDDDEILDKSLWEVIENALDESHSFENENSRGEDTSGPAISLVENGTVDITVTVLDEDGEEIELPAVQVVRHSSD
jgi:ubiquitin-activating enzyme E1